MDNVTTLAELQAFFAAATVDGSLTLTPAMDVTDVLTSFLMSLPARQFTLLNPSNTLDGAGTSLTLAGGAAETWVIRGTNNQSVSVTGATLVFTQAQADFALTLSTTGTITLDQQSLPLAGQLDASTNQVAWSLPQAWQPQSVELAALANFISGNQLGALLPLLPLFVTVPLTALSFSFGFGRNGTTTFAVTSNMNETWTIIDQAGFPSVEQVGITLNTSSIYKPGYGFQTGIGGNIHGTLVIGTPFQVVLALQGQSTWQLAIIPADGNVLPGLSALAGLVGGATLQQTVQDGLDALGLSTIALDQVAIKFDPYALAFQSVGMFGHVTIEGITFNVRVFLPVFQFYGSLNPGTPIDLKALVTAYFGDPDTFPAVAITALGVIALPEQSRYTLNATINSDWTMSVGTVEFGFREFGFEIVYQPTGVTGFIEAALLFVDVVFDASAEHPEVDGGWQFSGRTPVDQAMPIGQFMQSLAGVFGSATTLPAPIADLTLQNINVWFDTASSDFLFGCEAKFPINDQELDIVVNIALTHTGSSYANTFSGHITIGTLIFDLHFDANPTADLFVATYSHTGAQASISLQELVAAVSADVAAYIPASLTIDLKDVLFAYQQDTQTRFAFGLDLATGLNLSDLPLVGQALPPNQTIAVNDLQILVASLDFPAATVTQLNTIITPNGVTALPSPLAAGITVGAQMSFGTATQALSLPIAGDSSTVTPPQPPPSSTSVVASAASATWFTVQKSFGPVYFERVGVQYEDSTLWFLLDASLTAAGLNLSVEGLGFGSELAVFSPSFRIQGLGLDYRSAALEIGGSFVHVTVQNQSQTYDEYDGIAVLRIKRFSIGAIGSYAYLDEHPSLFVYAVLDFPLGGPAFFFVTGLSAGFGYNRALSVPPLDQVATFPLVAEAINGPPSSASDPQTTLQSELDKLRTYIPPAIGEVFLSAGIRWNTYRLIDAFALLTVSFGQHFEIDLLGMATAILPTPDLSSVVTPLAEVQMALVASFIPDEGFIGVQAQLTSASYVLSRSCHITGGFAFYAWFAKQHAGDFVLTLGGYHPAFTVPAHYPLVPRLGFNWQIDSALILKGGMYAAMTGALLMAGSTLQATWQSGDLKAWFSGAADFLLAWKPYHYDARLSVDVGVSYTFHLFGTHQITADVGADLHIWGPDFSGTAHIDLDIISFDIAFGAAAPTAPAPLDWATFKTSFLPADDQVCGIAVVAGLVQSPQSDSTTDWVINPGTFALATNCVIPIQAAQLGAQTITLDQDYTLAVGVAPMAVAPTALTALHTITITRSGVSVETDFVAEPIGKGMPAALWGGEFAPTLESAPLVPNAVAGFTLRPQLPPTPGATAAIDQSYLQYATQAVAAAYAWSADRPFAAQTQTDAQRRATISATVTAAQPSALRDQLLQAFGVSSPVELQPTLAATFTVAPQVGVFPDES